jgi:CHASE2 domain-containing sensor protein
MNHRKTTLHVVSLVLQAMLLVLSLVSLALKGFDPLIITLIGLAAAGMLIQGIALTRQT